MAKAEMAAAIEEAVANRYWREHMVKELRSSPPVGRSAESTSSCLRAGSLPGTDRLHLRHRRIYRPSSRFTLREGCDPPVGYGSCSESSQKF